MKLKNFYQMQRILDFKIEEKFDLDERQTVFDKLLALIVELGEASNEHRGFKFWSENRKPSLSYNKGSDSETNPLLEEYVDCLHFGLSAGISLGIGFEGVEPRIHPNTTKLTLKTVSWVIKMVEAYDMEYNKGILERRYRVMLEYLLGLGMAYGFTEDQIEEAYIKKHRINLDRQLSGY